MGWSSGSGLAHDLIVTIKKNVKDKDTRRKIYVVLIDSFENYDCDTLNECVGIDPVFDEFFPEEDNE